MAHGPESQAPPNSTNCCEPRRNSPRWDYISAVLKDTIGVYRYSGRAIELVWRTSRGLTLALFGLSLVGGVLPAAVAWVGKLIVDAVVGAIQGRPGATTEHALWYVALELALVIALSATQRAVGVVRIAAPGPARPSRQRDDPREGAHARARSLRGLGVLRQADPRRREASSRPLSLVMRTFGLVAERDLARSATARCCSRFSPGPCSCSSSPRCPAFVAETRFSGDAFRLFRWRTPETRQQMYLETVIAREDYAKEVKLFGLGPRLLERYDEIFKTPVRRGSQPHAARGIWGFALGLLLGTAAFYAAYAWIVRVGVRGAITPRRHDDVRARVQAGPVRADRRRSRRSAGCTRTTCTSRTSTSSSSRTSRRRAATRASDREPGDGIRFEHVVVHLSRARARRR